MYRSLVQIFYVITNRAFVSHSTVAVRKRDRIFFGTIAARYTVVGVTGRFIAPTDTAAVLVHLTVGAAGRHYTHKTNMRYSLFVFKTSDTIQSQVLLWSY